MAIDLRVVFPNRPGTVLKACETLARAGINIEGFGGDIRPGEPWGFVHLLLDDGERGMEMLEREGFEVVDVHDVDVVAAENEPGALLEILRDYADRGENIEVFYPASGGRIVVGTESMRRPISGVRMEDATYRYRPRPT